jgi:hypothetical protein
MLALLHLGKDAFLLDALLETPERCLKGLVLP